MNRLAPRISSAHVLSFNTASEAESAALSQMCTLFFELIIALALRLEHMFRSASCVFLLLFFPLSVKGVVSVAFYPPTAHLFHANKISLVCVPKASSLFSLFLPTFTCFFPSHFDGFAFPQSIFLSCAFCDLLSLALLFPCFTHMGLFHKSFTLVSAL